MTLRTKPVKEKPIERLSHKQQLPKKISAPPRKKIRQILRSMLPMEAEFRQLKEEQSL